MIGKPMSSAQLAVVSMMKNVALLEGMLLWQRRDFKMGFKEKDGPMMAFGFICGNFFMIFIHLHVELRYIATIGVLGLFSMVLTLPMANLLPQAMKVMSTRSKLRKKQLKGEKHASSNKPAPSRAKRQSRKQLTVLLGRIFHRVDDDNSGLINNLHVFIRISTLGVEFVFLIIYINIRNYVVCFYRECDGGRVVGSAQRVGRVEKGTNQRTSA